MPTWGRWDIQGNELPSDSLPPALEGVAAAIETASRKLGQATEILAIAEGFLATDPIGQAFGVLSATFDAIVNDLMAADIYALPMLPHSWRDLLHPYSSDDAIDDVIAAVSDQMDPNRPLFSAGAGYASITILVGADNWMDFRRLIKLFGEMFGAEQASKWARLADLRLQFDKYQRHPVPRAERGNHGETWDWYRTNWMDLFPALGDAFRTLQDLLDSAAGYPAGIAQALRDILEVIQERAAYVRQVATEVAALLYFIAHIAELVPNMAVLTVTSSAGGTAGYLDSLVNSSNKPKHKLCAGITLMAAGPMSTAYFDIMQRLLNLQVQAGASAAQQAGAV